MFTNCSTPCGPNLPLVLPVAPDCFICAPTPVPPLPLVANIASISANNPAVVKVSTVDASNFAGASTVTIAGTGVPMFDKQHLGVIVVGSAIALTGVNNSAGSALGAVGTITTP